MPRIVIPKGKRQGTLSALAALPGHRWKLLGDSGSERFNLLHLVDGCFSVSVRLSIYGSYLNLPIPENKEQVAVWAESQGAGLVIWVDDVAVAAVCPRDRVCLPAGVQRLVSLGGLPELSQEAMKGLKELSVWDPNVDWRTHHNSVPMPPRVGCNAIDNLEGLAYFSNLTTLNFHGCYYLENIDALDYQKNLTRLGFRYCCSLTNVDALANLTNLTCLDLIDCDALESVDALASLKNLARLNLNGCDLIANVDALANLTNLTRLDLNGCDTLANVDALANLNNLTWLDLGNCISLANVDALANLNNLTWLNLQGCYSLANVNALLYLSHLSHLNLSHLCDFSIFTSHWLTSIDALSNLTNLTKLDLESSFSLLNIEAISNLTNLTELNLAYCHPHPHVDALANLKNLTYLNLSNWRTLVDVDQYGRPLVPEDKHRYNFINIDGLACLTNLTELNLNGSCDLSHVDALANLTNLKSLDLGGCSQLTNIDVLANLTNLKSLDLSACSQLINIDVLAHLTSLASLDLGRCTGLGSAGSQTMANVDVLASLTRLTKINLVGLDSLVSVKVLANLPHLTELNLNRCSSIRDVDELSRSPNLQTLHYDVDPPAAMSVLASCAVNHPRKFSFISGLDAVALSKAPDLLVSRLGRLVPLRGAGEPAGVELCKLMAATRMRGEVSSATWGALFEVALSLGGPWLKEPLWKAVEALRPDADCGTILQPWLEAMSRIPYRDWALGIAEPLIAQVKGTNLERDLAPSVCLFYERMGKHGEVDAWLDRATAAPSSTWRDRIQLALAQAEMERGDIPLARKRIRELKTPTLLEEGHSLLAKAMATTLPAEAAEELAAIEDPLRRAADSAGLAQVPAFAGSLEGACELLLALEGNPEALADLLARMVKAHPASPLVAELARQLEPKGATLAETAQTLLMSPSVAERIKPVELRAFCERLSAEAAGRALARGLLDSLREEGLINDRERVQIMREKGLDRILEARS